MWQILPEFWVLTISRVSGAEEEGVIGGGKRFGNVSGERVEPCFSVSFLSIFWIIWHSFFKKTNDVRIKKIMSAFYNFQPT